MNTEIMFSHKSDMWETPQAFFDELNAEFHTASVWRRKKMNCHGCKHLDEVKKCPPGTGYCCQVERSKFYHTMDCAIDLGHRAPRIRRPEDERCELHEAGDFATRYIRPAEGEV